MKDLAVAVHLGQGGGDVAARVAVRADHDDRRVPGHLRDAPVLRRVRVDPADAVDVAEVAEEVGLRPDVDEDEIRPPDHVPGTHLPVAEAVQRCFRDSGGHGERGGPARGPRRAAPPGAGRPAIARSMSMPLFDRAARAGRRGDEGPKVWRVAELNRRTMALLEATFRPSIWVEGELSNVRRRNGHVYFTLNDGDTAAAVAGVMFQSDAARARARLVDGEAVRLRAQVSLYVPRGQFQLVARAALPAGDGDRQARLERLKAKLAGEGLFAVERKRPLPLLPGTVGLVTSRQGAALGDVLRVAGRRFPVRFVVADCRVQGPDAPASLTRALETIQRLEEVDVVVVTRGGGSAEDLWPFDDEALVRAVAACRVPVVSAVGHEQDTCLVDLVADVRAATPSQAAELVVPDGDALRDRLASRRRQLAHALHRRLGRERAALRDLSDRFGEPRSAIWTHRQTLDGHVEDLRRAWGRVHGTRRAALADGERAVRRHEPRARLARDAARLRTLGERLAVEGRRVVEDRRRRLASLDDAARALRRPTLAAARARHGGLVGRLDALSPLRVLARGYAVALDADAGRALFDARDVAPGDRVDVRLHQGRLETRVEAVRADPDEPGAP